MITLKRTVLLLLFAGCIYAQPPTTIDPNTFISNGVTTLNTNFSNLYLGKIGHWHGAGVPGSFPFSIMYDLYFNDSSQGSVYGCFRAVACNAVAANNWVLISGGGGGGTGTVTVISGNGPTWLNWAITNPTTTPSITLVPASGQSPHQVIGTCGSAVTFTPCTLLGADLPLFTSSLSGVVPSSGGGTTSFLRADGAWIPTSASIGGAVIGGTTGYSLYVGAGPVIAQEATLGAARFPALTGDVTSAGGSLATTISASSVSLAKMANLAANSTICNNTGSGAAPIACSIAQMQTLLVVPTTSATIISFFTGCSGSQYLGADGACHSAAGAGTVTSAAQTFTGGLISVAGSPITTSGTFALTVAGTSGGVPYFSGATTWASSGAMAAGQFMLGGGAGAAPTTSFSLVPRANGGLNSSSAGTGLLRDGTTPAASELTGDAVTSGSNAVTVSRINGTAFTGTNGDIVSFGASNTPADAGFLATNAVRKDAANTGAAAMTTNMTASTGANALRTPAQAGLTVSATGAEGEDTTAAMYHNFTGGVDSLEVTVPTATSITNGNCAQWIVSGSLKTLGQAGAACGSGGGGGNALTTVTFSATPTFTRSAANQEWVITLTGNVTSSTLSIASPADILVFNIIQDGTGGRTFAWPTGFTEACTISPTASIATKQAFYWDGSAAHAITPCVTTDATLIITGATSTAPATPASGNGTIYLDSTSKNIAVKDDAGIVKHGVQTKAAVSNNFVTAISDAGVVAVAQPAVTDISGFGTGVATSLGVNLSAAGGMTTTVASGTSALGTSAIASGACATVVTTTATGTASTDSISWNPNASIKAVTGYVPATTGGLSVAGYPTANNVNWDVCNWSSGSITPGAVTLNWRVTR